jgi:branched-subunit amino acid aminotransferase/4-amino-4-deoxychorismate lyase
MQAISRGVNEGILLNAQRYVAEASASNIFLIDDGTIATPSVNDGILPGITRQVILEIATSMGIKVVERRIAFDELFTCQECFLTNTLIEVMPLVEIDRRQIGSGKPGSLTAKLHQAYRELVKEEARKYLDSN